jgi:hypothetical protein
LTPPGSPPIRGKRLFPLGVRGIGSPADDTGGRGGIVPPGKPGAWGRRATRCNRRREPGPEGVGAVLAARSARKERAKGLREASSYKGALRGPPPLWGKRRRERSERGGGFPLRAFPYTPNHLLRITSIYYEKHLLFSFSRLSIFLSSFLQEAEQLYKLRITFIYQEKQNSFVYRLKTIIHIFS